MKAQTEFRDLLSGGDRRSIADSWRVRALIEQRPLRAKTLAALTADEDWLVAHAPYHCFAGRRPSRSDRPEARCPRSRREILHLGRPFRRRAYAWRRARFRPSRSAGRRRLYAFDENG